MIREVSDVEETIALLDERINRDPVGGTVLGTIRDVLVANGSGGWCVISTSSDGLAVRSDRWHPVQVEGDWDSDPEQLAALAGQLRALADADDLAALSGPPQTVLALAGHLPQPTHRTGLRLFRLSTLAPPTGVPGRARRAGRTDRDRLLDWYRAFAVEALGNLAGIEKSVDAALDARGCWLWEDGGRLVALATRRPVVAGCARIGPVYTPAQSRGRGYGSAVTAAATQDILDDAAIPVLFTDLSNPVSNGIYQRLGYQPVTDRLELRWR